MAAAPSTAEAYFDLVRRSGLMTAKRLDAYLARRPLGGEPPRAALAAAQAAVADGLLTKFQAAQLLQGRWRNFVIAKKYLILEQIGSGGSSTVFLGQHLVMQRPVAIKVLPTTRAENPEALARFLREARAAAMLDHPNIADFYDIDRVDSLHFLVMEFVHGPDLESLVHVHGPLPTARAAEYIRQAASALQHAHEAGMVHRDVKPSNLLVDRSGTVKLLDLGLVRIFQSDDGLTKGQNFRYVLGTLDYQAPEQAIDSHEVDIRADIYSLGATFYYLLTGQPVFPEGTVAEKLSWHQKRRPRAIGDYRKDVPPGLIAVVDRMMAKSLEDRYQEPADVVEALEEWTVEPIEPPGEAELPRLSKAAKAVLDTRPRPSSTTPSASRRVHQPTPAPSVHAPRPVEVAPASPTGTALVVASQSPAPAPARRSRKRSLLLGAACLAGLALAGSRIYGLIGDAGAETADAPPPGPSPVSVTAPAPPPQGIGLLDMIAQLNPVIAAEVKPDVKAKHLVRRGELHGRLGLWRQAAADLGEAFELDPTDPWLLYPVATTRAEIGDKAGFRERSLQFHRQFGSTSDPLMWERIAKLWLLTPECPGDPAIPAKLADQALASDPTERFYYWIVLTKGIADFRAGRYADAASRLKKGLESTPASSPQCKALTGLFLSLALLRQDKAAEARQALDQAAQLIDRNQFVNGGDLGNDWGDWLMCRIVRREAEEALGVAR